MLSILIWDSVSQLLNCAAIWKEGRVEFCLVTLLFLKCLFTGLVKDNYYTCQKTITLKNTILLLYCINILCWPSCIAGFKIWKTLCVFYSVKVSLSEKALSMFSKCWILKTQRRFELKAKSAKFFFSFHFFTFLQRSSQRGRLGGNEIRNK